MTKQLKITKDGSHTIWESKLDETYHSMNGAIQESQHVFIARGLQYCYSLNDQALDILEIGFGTGLNAWLTWMFAKNKCSYINYTTLEPFPLAQELTQQLNYNNYSIGTNYHKRFSKLHQASWNAKHQMDEYFTFRKLKTTIQNYVDDHKFDLIYFDAFAPSKQPEMWELPVFQKIHQYMKPGAALVSYCAQGQFKRNLEAVGLKVERLEGPPGKFEMTRGLFI